MNRSDWIFQLLEHNLCLHKCMSELTAFYRHLTNLTSIKASSRPSCAACVLICPHTYSRTFGLSV